MQRRGKKDQEKGERVSILIPMVHYSFDFNL
jgi:hypothetical protein